MQARSHRTWTGRPNKREWVDGMREAHEEVKWEREIRDEGEIRKRGRGV